MENSSGTPNLGASLEGICLRLDTDLNMKSQLIEHLNKFK